MRKTALLFVVLSLSATAACGEGVKFTTKPTAKKVITIKKGADGTTTAQVDEQDDTED